MPKIVFLMGVAGSGKTTVLNQSGLLTNPGFLYIPSYTTRPMRAGEVNGEKYVHISHEEFLQKIEQDEFLEYATVHQVALYGTEYNSIVAPLQQQKNSIKEIEIYGLIKIQEEKRIEGLYTTIFLDIPLEIMSMRMQQRQHIEHDELTRRLNSASFEKSEAAKRCDHIIDATQSLEDVCAQVNNICSHL